MKKIISVSSIVPSATGAITVREARTCFTVTGRIESIRFEDGSIDSESQAEFGGAKIVCKLDGIDAKRLADQAAMLNPVPLSIGFKVEALLDFPEYSEDYGYSMTTSAEYVPQSIHVGMTPTQLDAVHRNEYSQDASQRSKQQLAVNRQKKANELAQQALKTRTKAKR